MDDGYPGTRELVLGALSPELRTVFETAPRTSWIPLEQDAAFVDAIVDRLGLGLSRELWTRYTARFAQSPMQRALFDGATRLFGLSVGSLVKILPRIWTTSYRGAGQLDAHEAGDNWRLLHITDMHPAMCERAGYLILLRAMFEGMYELANTGDPDFDLRFDEQSRELHVEFRWS
jgi:hypothetical protein